jgi:hypothetical protein
MPFLNELLLQSVQGTERGFTVAQDFHYETLAGASIIVPMGYRTDLASVPRAFFWLFPPSGKYREAAVVHDFIYTNLTTIYTRSQADQIFMDAMSELGVSWWRRKMMWSAVRVGGRGNW